MRFITVNEIPKKESLKNRSYSNVRAQLEEFMKMNVKYAKVLYTNEEYSSVASMSHTIARSISRASFPIRLVENFNNVYLVRTDME